MSYATSMMASMCLHQPRQVIEIGMKVLRYLQKTIRYQLRVKAEGKSLVMFSDAAFAPMGGRSHGGWAIMYAGTPIMWRSGRQAMITLSTAEAELLAVIDGAIAMKGIEALLNDMGVFMEEKKIASDSMAALSITSGSSSWRTRHLKIKAAWIQEQIAHKEFTTVHWPGERQPADLLTKALSSARLGYLLQWWRVGEHVTPTQVAMSRPMVSSRALVAIICCLLLVSVRAADDDEDQSRSSMGGHLQLHQDTAGILMILLMVLGIMAVWEMIRWVLIEICTEWTPGANARRLRRLQKLQAATTAAIEGELSRLQSLEEPSRVTTSTTTKPRFQEEAVQRSTSTSLHHLLQDRDSTRRRYVKPSQRVLLQRHRRKGPICNNLRHQGLDNSGI